MVLPAQQSIHRSSRVYNTITISKSKYARTQAHATTSYPDNETDSDTDTSVYEHNGNDILYLAFGTTCHQDLYPRWSSRLVVSRPKKVVRRVVPPRKKIQWPDAKNHKELAIFYHKQIEVRVKCGVTTSESSGGSIISTSSREGKELVVRDPNNDIDLTCTGLFPSRFEREHEKHRLRLGSGTMNTHIGATAAAATASSTSTFGLRNCLTAENER